MDQKPPSDTEMHLRSPKIIDIDSIRSHHDEKKRKSALFRKETFYGASDEHLYEDSHLKWEVDQLNGVSPSHYADITKC